MAEESVGKALQDAKVNYKDIEQAFVGYVFGKWQKNEDHSSEIRGLRWMKCSSETLQNLLYFMYNKTHVSSFFRFSFLATLYFYLINSLVYVDIDQGIHKAKI